MTQIFADKKEKYRLRFQLENKSKQTAFICVNLRPNYI